MSRRPEELMEAIQAWDWLEQTPDAPLLLRLAAAMYILFLAAGVDSPAALLRSPRLRPVYVGIVQTARLRVRWITLPDGTQVPVWEEEN